MSRGSDRSEFAAQVLGSLSAGVVAIDARGALAFVNEGARRILGGPPAPLDAAIGRDCRDVYAAQPAVVRLLLGALDGQHSLSRAELALEGPEGCAPSTIGFTLATVGDPSGSKTGAAMIFRDLTPFERSSEQERLRERLAALGQMAAGLAHEIRNPLAGMEVLAGLLKRRLSDRPEEVGLVEELRGQLRLVADTVTASLDFVRPVALAHGPVAMPELVGECLSVARARVPFDGEVEVLCEDELPPISADADQLRALITNLVVNALQAMTEEPTGRARRLAISLQSRPAERIARPVRVGTDGNTPVSEDPPERELHLTVADTGPGIPFEQRERIFYPFFTTKRRGSGVGLAIAQKIAASHDGALELTSGDGSGAVFRLRLPLQGDEK